MMDRFSVAVLERTIELVAEAMPPDGDPSVADAVKVIQQYIEAPDRDDETDLRQAVNRLLEIVRQNHQFLIATRLSSIARRLDEKSDMA